MIAAQGLAVDWSLGGEKNCVVYRVFCIFIIMIVTSGIRISSVALLNCLYFKH